MRDPEQLAAVQRIVAAQQAREYRPEMHPADIKAAIQKNGARMSDIARTQNVSRVAVSHVVYGRSTSHAIAREIARITNIPASTLWPHRYGDLP